MIALFAHSLGQESCSLLAGHFNLVAWLVAGIFFWQIWRARKGL
jgi:hypothetical protein